MKKFNELLTEAKETIVFTFGRFNPPTIGHEKLIQKVASVAGNNPYRIYPSHTTNPKKDPLPHALKVAYMRKMFKKYSKNIIADKKMKTAIMIAEALYKEGFKNLIMVVGSDRVPEFSTLLNRYNDAPDKKGNQLFKFDSVKVVSAGERDPDSEGVEGMSASKMRAAAADGNKDAFLTGLPKTFKEGEKLYRDLRKNMGIREERDMGDMTNFETVRDMYLTGKIWNAGDIVEAKGVTGEVIRKGTNYLSFVDEDGKVHKAWLHDIELDEGFVDKIKKAKDFAKNKIAKIKKALSTEKAETKKMLAIYKNRKNASKVELKYANDQFKDILKGLGLITFTAIPVPGGGLLLATLTSVAKTKFNINILPSAFYEEIELDERNYRKEYDNYQGRPEQIARRSSRNKARRIMGDKTKIGMDVGHKDNNPMNNDPKNLKNEDPTKNRREPRLREEEEFTLNLDEMKGLTPETIKTLKQAFGKMKKLNTKTPSGKAIIAFVNDRTTDELKSLEKAKIKHLSSLAKVELKRRKKLGEEESIDEDWGDSLPWLKRLKQKVFDKTHKKGLDNLSYEYAKRAAKEYKKNKRMNPIHIIHDLSRIYDNVTDRVLRDHINDLVKKGLIPKELKAEYEPQNETMSFKDFVNQIQTNEVLSKDADAGEYIKDFKKSDAPQFKGKSKKKRKQMAVAAYLDNKKDK